MTLIIPKSSVKMQDRTLFTHDKLVISQNKIIGIVGRNGVGKTTFLNNIASIIKKKDNESYSYVQQLLENTNPISGGEKVKTALLRAFDTRSDILLLDEPSANLDEKHCKWLIQKLYKFEGIILMVSHDIAFLNLANEIWLINNNKLKVYTGNYESYIKLRKKDEEKRDQIYKNQQRQIKHLKNEIIKRKQRAYRLKKGNGKRMTNSEKKASGRTSHDGMERKMQAGAKAIEKRIVRMDLVHKVVTHKPIKFIEIHKELYLRKTILKMKNQDICINNKILINKATISLKYGNKLWLRGNNGAGKTTLVQKILRERDKFISEKIDVGYFNQDLKQINPTVSIWNNAAVGSNQPNQVIYAVLGGLGFKKINQKGQELSGGQIVRLQLAKVLLGNNQILILDEPTNYLDLDTKEALKDFLENYPGTLILISHDQEFARSVTDSELLISNKALVSPDSLIHHSSANTGELIKLRLQLDQQINSPSVSFDKIQENKNKIKKLKNIDN